MMWNYFNALARCMQNREKFTNVQCMMATDCRVKRDRNRRRERESELVQKWKESNGKYRNHSIERHTIFVCETIERKNAAQNVYVHKYINCFAFAVLLSIYNWERLSKWEIEHFSIRWLIFFRSLSLSHSWLVWCFFSVFLSRRQYKKTQTRKQSDLWHTIFCSNEKKYFLCTLFSGSAWGDRDREGRKRNRERISLSFLVMPNGGCTDLPFKMKQIKHLMVCALKSRRLPIFQIMLKMRSTRQKSASAGPGGEGILSQPGIQNKNERNRVYSTNGEKLQPNQVKHNNHVSTNFFFLT